MAYMNLNTFELLHEVDFSDGVSKSSREMTVGDCKNHIPTITNECQGTWVELDDLIAPVISELNKKGYKTLFSCSGHAEGMSIHIPKNPKSTDDIEMERLYPHAYIKFAEGIVIPKDLIPAGWGYDKEVNAIYFHYDIYPVFITEKPSNLIAMQKNQRIMSVMTDLFADVKKWPRYSLDESIKDYFKIDSVGNMTVTMVPDMFTGKLFKLPEYTNILFSCSRVDELSISLSPAVMSWSMYGQIADELIMSSSTMYNRLRSDGLSKITIIEPDEKGK